MIFTPYSASEGSWKDIGALGYEYTWSNRREGDQLVEERTE